MVVVQSLGRVPLFVTPWTLARQAPLPMEFSRQEYWSGLPFPLPGDLPDPGIEPESLAFPALAGWFFTARATWEDQSPLQQSVITNVSLLCYILLERSSGPVHTQQREY